MADARCLQARKKPRRRIAGAKLFAGVWKARQRKGSVSDSPFSSSGAFGPNEGAAAGRTFKAPFAGRGVGHERRAFAAKRV